MRQKYIYVYVSRFINSDFRHIRLFLKLDFFRQLSALLIASDQLRLMCPDITNLSAWITLGMTQAYPSLWWGFQNRCKKNEDASSQSPYKQSPRATVQNSPVAQETSAPEETGIYWNVLCCWLNTVWIVLAFPLSLRVTLRGMLNTFWNAIWAARASTKFWPARRIRKNPFGIVFYTTSI